VSQPRNGEVKIWNLVSGVPPRAVKIGVKVIRAVSTAGQALATSDWEHLSLWDLRSGECLYAMAPSLNWHVMDAAFSPDGLFAAAGMEPIPELYPYDECRETAVLWDAASAQNKKLLKGDLPAHHGPLAVRAVAFSPDSQLLACGPSYGAIKLWETASGQRRGGLDGSPSGIEVLAFSPEGYFLASGHDNGAVLLWTLSLNRKPHRLRDTGSHVSALCFSGDGAILASGYQDGSIGLWEAQPVARAFLTLPQQPGSVRSLAFLPGTWTLAAEYDEGSVRLWNGLTGCEEGGFNTTN
jgi:WD40 repeat protein